MNPGAARKEQRTAHNAWEFLFCTAFRECVNRRVGATSLGPALGESSRLPGRFFWLTHRFSGAQDAVNSVDVSDGSNDDIERTMRALADSWIAAGFVWNL